MAKLAARFGWSLVVAYIVILFVAALLTIMMWFEIDDEGMFRLLTVAVILDAAITVVIPIGRIPDFPEQCVGKDGL